MSNSVNEVTLIGHAGKDPEVRYTPAGKEVANVSLATSKKWKDNSTGEQKEKTEWHRVVFFGQAATFVANHIKKGMQLYIRGELQTRDFQDNNGGGTRYITEIVVQGFDGKVNIINNNQPKQNVPQSNSIRQAAPQQSAPQQTAPAYQSAPAYVGR